MVRITEDQKKTLELYLSNMRMAIEKIDTIKEVVRTFDNKVYNKRLENKICEVLNEGLSSTKQLYFHISLDNRNLKMELCFYNNRSFAGEKYFCYLPSGYEKIDVIPYTYTDYNAYYTEKNGKYFERQDDCYYYIDGGNLRLNADYICKRLDEGKQDLKDRMARIETDNARFVEYETKRAELVEQLKDLQNNMAYELKAMYNSKDYSLYI